MRARKPIVPPAKFQQPYKRHIDLGKLIKDASHIRKKAKVANNAEKIYKKRFRANLQRVNRQSLQHRSRAFVIYTNPKFGGATSQTNAQWLTRNYYGRQRPLAMPTYDFNGLMGNMIHLMWY